MKLERINEFVLVVTVLVVGTIAALLVGRYSGSGDTGTLMKISAVAIACLICFTMRANIWLLIPLTWPLTGQLGSLPGHLPVRDVFILLVFGFFFTLKAVKAVNTRPRFTWLDFILLLNVLYLVSVYLRNPVGVNAFGSTRVGGRPYMEVIFALMAYWILTQVHLKPKVAFLLPFWGLLVNLGIASLNTITYLFPSTAPVIGRIYNGISVETYNREMAGGDQDDSLVRAQFLSNTGGTLLLTLVSYFSPLRLISPLAFLRWGFIIISQFGLLLISIFLVMKSGHRLTAPFFGAALLLSVYFRRGFSGVVLLSCIGLPPLLIILMMQGNLINLPETAQRTLSFIPGVKWDYLAVNDAKNSSEWRYEMWRIVLHNEKYIKNKVFGDGFGFTQEQFAQMQASRDAQENFMISGDVHSGPISTIRFVGYVGLVLYLLLICCMAGRAWNLVKASKDTPYFPLALFVGISVIYTPLSFVFIFGAYNTDLPQSISYLGMLNLISNALKVEKQRIAIEETPPLPTTPAVNRPQLAHVS